MYKLLEFKRVSIITVYLPVLVKVTQSEEVFFFPLPPKPFTREEQTTDRKDSVLYFTSFIVNAP